MADMQSKSSRYKYKVSLTHVKGSEETFIIESAIKTIIIDRSYYIRNMPIIIVILNLNAADYQKFVLGRFNSQVVLHIERYDMNSQSSVSKDIIKDTFTYFLPDNNPNYTKSMDEEGDTIDNAYKRLTIGLLSTKLIDQNRVVFNKVYKDTNMATLVQLGIQNIPKVIMEPIKNNRQLSAIHVPPISSISKYIAYLDSYCNLYSGGYCFFMDFDYTYLISNDGKIIDIKDGTYNTISIDIQNTITDESKLIGMITDNKQKLYKIYVDALSTSLSIDEQTDYIMNKFMAVTTSGATREGDIDIMGSNTSKKMLFERIANENSSAMSSINHDPGIIIGISKPELDSGVLQPNKEWIISNFEDNEEYNGNYYMIYKKDILLQQDGEFTCNTSVGLSMV